MEAESPAGGRISRALGNWSIAALRRDIKRCKRPLRSRALDLPENTPEIDGVTSCDLAVALKSAGFEVATGEGCLAAVRGRYSPLWGRAAVILAPLLLAALLLNAATTSSEPMRVSEGGSLAEALDDPTTAEVPQSVARLAGVTLTRVTPRFFSGSNVVGLSAEARVRGVSRRFSRMSPLWLSPATYVSIRGFDYTPVIRVHPRGKTAVEITPDSLRLYPPGKQDEYRITSARMSLVMEVYPDHVVSDGEDSTRSDALVSPRVKVTVVERLGSNANPRIMARRTVEPSQTIELPDGSTVTIAAVNYLAKLRLVEAPFMPAVLILAALFLLALAIRVIVPRCDVVACDTAQGLRFVARVGSSNVEAGTRTVTRIASRRKQAS